MDRIVIKRLLSVSALWLLAQGACLPAHADAGEEAARAASWIGHPEQPLKLGEWEAVRLQRRSGAEAGKPNAHPVRLTPAQLAPMLASVRLAGESASLFAPSEQEQLAHALAAALSMATPDQDVLFLTRGRHGDKGFIGMDLANAGRVFVADGKLNLIVGTAQSDLLNRLRPGIRPAREPDPGTRSHAGAVALAAGQGGLAPRSDWLAFGLDGPASAPVAAPAATPMAPSTSTGVEERLRTLKRLHEQQLITDTEYQQKRAEILKSL